MCAFVVHFFILFYNGQIVMCQRQLYRWRALVIISWKPQINAATKIIRLLFQRLQTLNHTSFTYGGTKAVKVCKFHALLKSPYSNSGWDPPINKINREIVHLAASSLICITAYFHFHPRFLFTLTHVQVIISWDLSQNSHFSHKSTWHTNDSVFCYFEGIFGAQTTIKSWHNWRKYSLYKMKWKCWYTFLHIDRFSTFLLLCFSSLCLSLVFVTKGAVLQNNYFHITIFYCPLTCFVMQEPSTGI